MANDVVVTFGAKIDELISGVDAVKARVEGLSTGFLRLAEIAGIALSVEGLKNYISSMADLGLQTERTMAQLGLSAEATVQLQGFAKLTGSSIEGLSLAFERLYLNVQRSTRDAFTPGAQAMKALGLSVSDFTKTGGDANAVIDLLRSRVSELQPGLNLTAALVALGGRNFAQAIPFLRMTNEEWIKFKAALSDAQDGLARAVPGMAETHTQLVLMETSIQSLGARIFSALKPAIDWAVSAFTQWVQSLNEEKIRTFSRTLVDTLGNAIINLVVMFRTFGTTIDEVVLKLERMVAGGVIGAGLGLLAGPGAAIGVPGGAALGAGVVALWDTFIAKWMAGANDAKSQVDKDTADIVAKIKKMMSDITAAITMAPLTLKGIHEAVFGAAGEAVGTMDFGARQAIEAQIARIAQQQALEQGFFDRQKLLYQFDADNYATSQMTKVARTIETAKIFYDVEDANLARIRDLWGQGTKEWEDAERKRVLAKEKANTELLKLDIEYFKTARAEVAGYVDAFQSSWNSSLRNVLAGTMTFGAAMKKAFGDLIIYMIEQLEKKFIFEQAITLLTTTLFGQAEATKTGMAAAGEATRQAIMIPNIIRNILNSAKEVFAGVFAFLSPEMGPAAGVPAAAAAGIVAGSAAAIYDVGTDYVTRSGLAFIHRGEMVRPAQDTGPYTGAGMGDTNVSVNISAVDAHSFSNLVNNNPSIFTDLIRKAIRDQRMPSVSLARNFG